MDCEEIQKNLAAYLDGELSDEDTERFDAHLAQCKSCWKEITALREGETVEFKPVGGDPAGSVPGELSGRPGAGSEPSLPASRRPVRWERKVPWERSPAVWLSAATAVMLALVCVHMISRALDRPRTTGDEAASDLRHLLNASEVIITRLLNAQPGELAAISRHVRQKALVDRIAEERSRTTQPIVQYHLDRLKRVMFRLVNVDITTPESDLRSLQSIVNATDLLGRNDTIRSHYAIKTSGPRR